MFWSSLQTFGNQVIGFGMSILLARLLLPAEFGLIGMINIFMGIGSILISGGLTNSIIRTERPDHADYSTVFVFNLVTSVILYTIMFFAAAYVAAFFKQPQLKIITRLYCLIFIIQAFSAVQLARYHKHMDFKSETKASLVSTVISALVGVGMAYQGFGVMSLVWMAIAGTSVNTLMLWLQSSWKPSLIFDADKFQYHFSFGSNMMASGLLSVLFSNVYTIIIGKFYSPAQLGFYNRADSLKELPISTFFTMLNKVTFPLFAEIKNDNVRLRSVYSRILKMSIFITTPLLVLMAVLAEPLFRFLFTEKWLPAVPYFQILSIGALLSPLHAYNQNILIVKGRSDVFLKLEIFKKILLIIIIAASFTFGINGLLWGQVLYSLLVFFMHAHYCGKFIDYSIWRQITDVLPTFILTGAMGGIIFLANINLSSWPDLVRLLLLGTTGVFIFLILARIFKFESGKHAVELVQSKIGNSLPGFLKRYSKTQQF